MHFQNTSLPDGSPLPNSPSSMVNQYRLEDDDEGKEDANTKDIFVTVDHPESQVTAIETFILYRVVTRVRWWSCVTVVTSCVSHSSLFGCFLPLQAF